MSDIILSRGVRDNLLSLQSTSELMARTQGRLATGKRVNSALDAPNAFFTAQGLANRAKDLSGLLDDMGQAVQVLKSADSGITSISKLIESAKAKATQAMQTSDRFERARFAQEYNDLLAQLEGIARDSGYNGKNLLGGAGNEVTVYFNEDNSNKLVIDAVDYTDPLAALGLPEQTVGTFGTLNISMTDGTNPLTGGSLIASDTGLDAGQTITFTSGATTLGAITITASMTINEFVTEINAQFNQVRASFTGGVLTLETAVDLAFTGGVAGENWDSRSVTATESDWVEESGVRATLTQLNEAQRMLRAQAATFGTNLSVLMNRETFTKEFVNTLSVGADKLVLADQNEEGANLLALQTRQQLSSTALSLAAQSDQAVLRLFG